MSKNTTTDKKLSTPQILVLEHLGNEGRAVPFSELRTRGVSPKTVSMLTEVGLLKRTQPKESKSPFFSITAAGRKALAKRSFKVKTAAV